MSILSMQPAVPQGPSASTAKRQAAPVGFGIGRLLPTRYRPARRCRRARRGLRTRIDRNRAARRPRNARISTNMAAGRPPRAPSSGKDASLLQEIEGKHQQAQQLFALKKYGEAVTVWRDALMKARDIQNQQTKRAVQPVIAGSLGCALDLHGEYKEAIEWHGKAFKTHGSLGDTLAQCGDICNAGNAYLNAASAGDVQAVSSAEECFGLGHVIALEHDHRDAAQTAQAGLANCQKMRSNLGMVQTESVKAPTLSSVAEEEKPADKPCPWNVKKTLSTAGSNALK